MDRRRATTSAACAHTARTPEPMAVAAACPAVYATGGASAMEMAELWSVGRTMGRGVFTSSIGPGRDQRSLGATQLWVLPGREGSFAASAVGRQRGGVPSGYSSTRLGFCASGGSPTLRARAHAHALHRPLRHVNHKVALTRHSCRAGCSPRVALASLKGALLPFFLTTLPKQDYFYLY